MSPISRLALILTTLCLPTVHAQTTRWVQASPAKSPPARKRHVMAYDEARQQTVVFGGFMGSGPGETWIWNGRTWTRALPQVNPDDGEKAAMAYDAARKNMVLFGGVGSMNWGYTCTWDGSNWNKIRPLTIPPHRSAHAMAYDAERKVVVLFGGRDTSTALADTWTWNGQIWRKEMPVTSPPAMSDHAMAYDAARKQVVLFGGAEKNFYADTWLWDGKTWTKAKPLTSPIARAAHAMTYDQERKVVVMNGGFSKYYHTDTWLWDGKHWTQAQSLPAPAARADQGMAYDAARKQVVVFGGAWPLAHGDTWLWGYHPTATTQAYGTACGAAPGVTLAAATNSLPVLGEKLTLEIKGLPSSTGAGLLAIGYSKTWFGPVQLPLDLTALGMTGCHLYNSFEHQFVFTKSGNLGSFQLAIPYRRSLVGNSVFAQAFGADAIANRLGLVASHGLELGFGYR